MKLTVVRIVGVDKGGNKLAECLCECGNICTTRLSRAVSGETKSCGCLVSKTKHKHGGVSDRRYSIACDIHKRCKNPNFKFYHRYGGRGIYCPETASDIYRMLLSVDGYFEGAEIDRINNDGDYELGNLRWVTRLENMKNTSRYRKENEYEERLINRCNFKRFCKSRGFEFENFEEIYSGIKIGKNKMYNYKIKIELREAK